MIEESKLTPKIVPSKGNSAKNQVPDVEPNSRAEILASVSAASINIQVGLILAYSAILIPQLTAPDTEIAVTKTEISWIGKTK